MYVFSRAAMLERDIDIGGVSVCPSHAGIDAKPMTVGSYGFHRRVAYS